MQTTYYSLLKSMSQEDLSKCVNISNKGMNIDQVDYLIPDWSTIVQPFKESSQRPLDIANFITVYYNKHLAKLDPQKVLKELEGKYLTCLEKYNKFCHRRVIANWIQLSTGVVVPEFNIPMEMLSFEEFIINTLKCVMN